ncbi:cobalamin biosynthesis protein [Sphingomonas mollis]|uniref:Cobalamin biosynthesis protein n=1 Tax=Sphingomonas mollis TaxID=2795726 RepID=A0ABS0XNV7_9SPHN|nr:cobalamin biosynthesis protein [Sphingomonas sp. BT553]MBJ6121723.1 cobalamin biosynthesis protein [Sphingomonas sp. BT553]
MERDAVIVAGFGCRAAVDITSLHDALAAAWAGKPVSALAAPADRCPLVEPLARALGVPLIAISPDRIGAADTPTRSPVSLHRRGTGSVAEAAALAAAGPDARLIVTRHISSDAMATCAIAEGPSS